MKAETELSARLGQVMLTPAATLGFRIYPFIEPVLLVRRPANDC